MIVTLSQAAEDVGGSLADKFNDLSSIHFATPQFSYIPAYLSDAVNVKKPDFDQIVYQKKSTLENLLKPTKESIRDLIHLKRKALDNIVNPQKTTIEKYVQSRRKKLGDLIEFKKSAINNLVVPKKDKIEDLIDLKRSKLAEIGSHFPGSERLRHELFSGAKRYQQKFLEPLRQAYQGLKEGLADGAGLVSFLTLVLTLMQRPDTLSPYSHCTCCLMVPSINHKLIPPSS